MPMIPEVKCRRCGETFSSLRSRCPNCGTRRVTQSSRTPSPTPGTVKGTAAYERAETNAKWQIIFGLILVTAVVLAVIVMVTTSLEGAAIKQQTTVITPPVVTEVDDPIDLTVQVMPLTLQGLQVSWQSSNPEILTIERTDEYAVHVECHDNGSLPSSCKLTLTCAGFEKELTVYCRPAK